MTFPVNSQTTISGFSKFLKLGNNQFFSIKELSQLSSNLI